MAMRLHKGMRSQFSENRTTIGLKQFCVMEANWARKDDLEKSVGNLSLRSIYKTTSSYVLSEIYILYFVAQHFTNYKSTIKLGLMFILNKRLVLVPLKKEEEEERDRD